MSYVFKNCHFSLTSAKVSQKTPFVLQFSIQKYMLKHFLIGKCVCWHFKHIFKMTPYEDGRYFDILIST